MACVLLVGAVQATTLKITVQDDDDGSAISEASIYIDGDYEGKTNSDGKYSYSHSLDEPFELEVRQSGYKDWSDWIDEDDTSVSVDLVLDTASVTILVYDADTLEPVDYARLKVTLEGSDETETARTRTDGSTTFKLAKDAKYTVEVSADDYVTDTWEYEVDADTVTLQRWLVHEDRIALRVLSADDQAPVVGARIFIDGKSAGVTGGNGILITHLDRKKQVQLRVEAESFRDLMVSRYINKDDLVLDLSLSLATYPVSLIAVNPAGVPVAGAAVFLDGEPKGETDTYGRFSLQDVLQGTYEIRITKDGFVAWEEERVIDQEGQDVAAEMMWELATVSVLVQDKDHQVIPGAKVSVNGDSFGISDAKGIISDSLPPADSYNFTASMDGYTTAWTVIGIEPGEEVRSVTITIEKELDMGLVWLAGLSAAGIILVGAGIVVVRRRTPKRRKGF
ncbi:MAG: carboxypeptidase-like regulatory domain-containing protein [Methanomicrobiaceae archaeon]|nr:carboxypeptidase-like regulatory domain-containing protein [Methanomicrobiaceae archaeon]